MFYNCCKKKNTTHIQKISPALTLTRKCVYMNLTAFCINRSNRTKSWRYIQLNSTKISTVKGLKYTTHIQKISPALTLTRKCEYRNFRPKNLWPVPKVHFSIWHGRICMWNRQDLPIKVTAYWFPVYEKSLNRWNTRVS